MYYILSAPSLFCCVHKIILLLFFCVTTGLTAIEAWMLACILFVFGALVEYAVILFRRQTSKDHVDPPPSRCSVSKFKAKLYIGTYIIKECARVN